MGVGVFEVGVAGFSSFLGACGVLDELPELLGLKEQM